MDGLGAEVSAKIRSAIKAKLIELEAYVDDELPDYIMVMVANNRTKTQMEDDLGLFLNNNTAAFTNWLHAVLEKLKKVTLEEVSKKDNKKKKPKKSEKQIKKSKEEKLKVKKSSRSSRDERKRSRSPKVREKKGSSSSRPAKPPPRSGGMDVSSGNANLEELGTRRKKKTSTGSLDNSGGTEGYNPASLLKSALIKTKENKLSPKKSTKKSSTSVKKEVKKKDERFEGNMEDEEEQKVVEEIPKTMINLKEETDFYAKKERDKEQRRSRSRSPRKSRCRSRSPPAKVASLVTKVVRPDVMPRLGRGGLDTRDRRRSRSQGSEGFGHDLEKEGRRGLWSRAQVPPRPKRPVGREEVGVARAVGRAIMEADRSIVRNRKEDPRDRDLRVKVKGRETAMLSPEEMLREDLKRRHQEVEARTGARDERQRVRDVRDRSREEVSRVEGKISSSRNRLAMDMEMPRSRLAMDMEVSRSVRSSSLDRKLLARREEKRTKHDSGDMRIIVRRELTPESEPEPEPEPEPELELESVIPLKKLKKLDVEDAELLDMRRKALESLMKRTDEDILPKRSNSMERRIKLRRVQDITDSSSESDDTTESEVSEQEPYRRKKTKTEPTFVVTLDGLENKYFKSKKKGALELARERIVEKPQPVINKVRKESPVKVEEVPESKYSSEDELELHPNEDFDDVTTPKKVVQQTSQDTSDRPVLKVAGRKRSPILASESYKSSGSKKVAEVRPVVAAQPAGPSSTRQPGKLAVVVKEPKVSQSVPVSKPPPVNVISKSQTQKGVSTTQNSAPTVAKVTTSKITTQKIIAPAKTVTKSVSVNNVSKTSVPVTSKSALVTSKPAQVSAKSNVVKSTVTSTVKKELSVKEDPAKTKIKRTPITAPTPDPYPVYTRFQPTPSILPFPTKTSQTVCKFWPACIRKDSCAFYHPLPPNSAEAILSTSANVNKFKWSAK